MENAQSMKTDPDYPIFEIGLKEGRAQMKKEALTFLQNKYLGENAPERGSIEAKAILQLARELSEELQ
jgi:hypothetical protein